MSDLVFQFPEYQLFEESDGEGYRLWTEEFRRQQ